MTPAGKTPPSPRIGPRAALLAVLGLGALVVAPALAQQAGSPFAGFTQNRSDPINFEADRAEVYDNEKKAILIGNVRIRQGESTLSTARLIIYYEDNNAGAQSGNRQQGRQASVPGAAGQQNVRRFEMEGGVTVTSKNQKAVADRGVFDARRNEAILEGNVVLTQCDNVLRGNRMFADITANRVRLEGGPTTAGRVSGLLTNNSGQGADCAPAPTPANRPRAQQPQRRG